jgi:hypothetical protein
MREFHRCKASALDVREALILIPAEDLVKGSEGPGSPFRRSGVSETVFRGFWGCGDRDPAKDRVARGSRGTRKLVDLSVWDNLKA